jgi:HD domain
MSFYLTDQFTRAVDYARHLHIKPREGTDIPHMAHLLGVASLVMGEVGEVSFPVTEDTIIAALLHETVEDHGGMTRMNDILHNFGPGVPDIVEGLTESFAEDSGAKEPWRKRKMAYLDRLRKAGPEVQLISAADTLHNARAILEDYRGLNQQIWGRFEHEHEDQLWYFTQLLEIFDSSEPNRIVDELHRVVAELKRSNFQGAPPERGIPEIILEVGAEGGSLAVIRDRNAEGMWEYRAQLDETTMSDVLPDEKFDKGDLFERSGPTSTFEDALSQLDRYPWFKLYPVKVHPDFAGLVLREVRRRGGHEAAGEWTRNLRH